MDIRLVPYSKIRRLDKQIFTDDERGGIAGSRHYAAYLGRRVAGYVVVQEHKDRWSIDRLGVNSRCRRQGIACALLGQVTADARHLKMRVLYATVASWNNESLNTFVACGYRFTGTTPDGLFLWLHLALCHDVRDELLAIAVACREALDANWAEFTATAVDG